MKNKTGKRAKIVGGMIRKFEGTLARALAKQGKRKYKGH